MSAEYQPNLSYVSQIPAEFLKLREYSSNVDISWIFYQPAEIEGSVWNVLSLAVGGIADFWIVSPDRRGNRHFVKFIHSLCEDKQTRRRGGYV